MPDDPLTPGPTLDEELVAYLDGELDAQCARRVEELLANDPQARRKLQELDRTWELLGELDEPPMGEGFTQSTLEMVAAAAGEEVQQSQAVLPRLRRRRWMVLMATLLGAGVAGFLAVALAVPDPNRQLRLDLPLLENLDQYRRIDSVEFLRMLRREKLFLEDESEATYPVQQEQLRRRQEQFASLAAPDQQHLRHLQQQLDGDPEATQLHLIVQRYCDWLKTLPLYRRAEVLESEPGERIKRIKKLLAEQARPAKGLNEPDAAALLRWMDQYVAANESRLLQTLSKPRRQQLLEMSPAKRLRVVAWLLEQQWQAAPPGKAPLTDNELAELRSQLSPGARDRLASKPPAEQWRILNSWLRHIARSHAVGRRPDDPLAASQEAELATLFEHELTDQQRDRLLSLPAEEMQRELRKMYFQRFRPAEASGSPGSVKKSSGTPPKAHHPKKPDRENRRPPEDAKTGEDRQEGRK